MNRLTLQPDWPQAWREAHGYDCAEVYGPPEPRGYAYAYDLRRRHTLALVAQAVPAGGRVLDIAAAQGNFSLALAERGYRVVWNDLRADLQGYVRLKHERGELEFAPGDAFQLGFGAEFDSVLITEIIEHVAHPDQFLRKVAGLVKPGGHVILTTPNGGYFRNRLPKFSECADPSVFEAEQFRPNADGHIFLLHEDEFAPLARAAGLEVVEQRLFTNSLTSGHLKTERLLRVLPRRVVSAIEAATQILPRALRRRACVAAAVLLRKPR